MSVVVSINVEIEMQDRDGVWRKGSATAVACASPTGTSLIEFRSLFEATFNEAVILYNKDVNFYSDEILPRENGGGGV